MVWEQRNGVSRESEKDKGFEIKKTGFSRVKKDTLGMCLKKSGSSLSQATLSQTKTGKEPRILSDEKGMF